MAISVVTNVASLRAQRNLAKTTNAMECEARFSKLSYLALFLH